MSETYTVGGDTYASISHDRRAGQTITPLETHTLDYIDLNLSQLFFPTTLELEIYDHTLPDWDEQPPLSRSTLHFPITPAWPSPKRHRFKMQPYTVLEGTRYAMVLYEHLPAVFGAIRWLYDQGDATYPRGNRLYKDGATAEWEGYGSDDHIFTEFGNPPLPKPEPNPPIPNFAPIAITYFSSPTKQIFKLSTNVPCHLTCYWTDKEPLKHHTTAVIRGIAVPWHTYFCFVAWNTVEQNEPGDTLYHTFTFPDWLFCQTRWFTIKGNVDDILSPSVGPIFKHHNPGHSLPLVLRNLSFEDWPDPDGNPFYWNRFIFGTGSSQWIREETWVHQGNYASLFFNRGYARGCGFRQVQDVRPWRGLNLTFKAWGTGYAYSNNDLTVGVNGTGGWLRHANLYPGTGYRQVSLSGIIPVDATEISIAVRGYCGPLYSASILWDNLTIELT